MRIKLLEPLNVSNDLIQTLAKPILDRGHEFVSYPEKTTSVDELLDRSSDADVVMIANTPYPAEVIQKVPELKLINVAFTGVDHVGVKAAKEKNILVSNASGYSTHAVSELVIGLTLGVYRHIVQGDDAIRRTPFPGVLQGQELNGKTIGILGTGNIGMQTARLFQAFGATVVAYSRTEKEEAIRQGIAYVSLDQLLASSDIVSVHLPLNENTTGFLSRTHLAQMKPSAVLINCARGPIVDSRALADALNQHKLAGAGIDVFDTEPPLESTNPLIGAKNALLTPHVAYLTNEAMIKRAHIAFSNTLAFLDGQPENLV